MDSKKSFDDKLFDIMVEEAVDMYARDIADSEPSSDMTGEEQKIMTEQKQRVYKKVRSQIHKTSKRKSHIFRKCLIAAACIVIVLAAAINVSAFREFVYKIYTEMSGSILNIRSNIEKNIAYSNIKLFEKKEEIVIPGWLPPKCELGQMTDEAYDLRFTYYNDNIWISLIEQSNTLLENNTNIETENNIVNITDYKVLDVDGKIVEFESESNKHIFIVNWSTDNAVYKLSSNCSRTVLETILDNLEFLY